MLQNVDHKCGDKDMQLLAHCREAGMRVLYATTTCHSTTTRGPDFLGQRPNAGRAKAVINGYGGCLTVNWLTLDHEGTLEGYLSLHGLILALISSI